MWVCDCVCVSVCVCGCEFGDVCVCVQYMCKRNCILEYGSMIDPCYICAYEDNILSSFSRRKTALCPPTTTARTWPQCRPCRGSTKGLR